MSANEYYTNSNYSSSGPGHQQPSSFDAQQTSSQQQHSSHSYPPQGQAHLHSYDNHLQLQDHAAAGRRRSSAISIPAGTADVSLNPHLAQGFLHHELVPNNDTPANHGGTSSVQQHSHPTTSHFCPVPVGQESNNISHGPNVSNGFNSPNDSNAPNGPGSPDGPDGERGLGATLVGGASGHFLAKQLGHGGGHHHGVLETTAGAVAANLLEHKLKKNHDQKNHDHQNQHAHDLGHGHGGGGGGLSGMFGGGGGGGKHPTLQQQAQQHHYPETHAGSGRGGYEQLGHGLGHGHGGVNQGHHEHGKHGKWGH
ncbi:hypothetical protein NEUTE1DRAFT_144895 [Neurospora tetrasperma FGSC 2508]|uniref:Glycine zipper 2TM domain-containing protein n=1 Tax=Neurospora tetrasperma (strain FGSC 2508 / ATCC MYA-4615 / P0657) TaxID=510951 RepID=F8MH03_NEUT8|nr:uncharacterized protein NEUTE1DRAFT_144895 [Neurospora tetrasperma FGSC 2508]EGO58722.1 hypothetical protein NEUTE1DRAFT_144895 [Neurospora tetrasperma FGSC 2508]EGZ72812.1 hypothetical protein NEUTE2DRAFT_106672 [Neurospora tetrasperma FGSC 2509]